MTANTTITIFDSLGEFSRVIDCSIEDVVYNLHAGESFVDGEHRGCYLLNDVPVKKPDRPTKYHVWNTDNHNWDAPADLDERLLSDAKRAKLSEVNRLAQKLIDDLSADTPEFEKSTWTQQAAEAKAWHIDTSTPTPMLAQIALNRGIALDVLRQKAYDKAVQYESIIATVTGKRQGYEDAIKQARTVDAVNVLVINYSE